MEITRSCGHTTWIEDWYGELFGVTSHETTPCEECATAIARYNDVYLAMAGNVYATARLAEAGLIPGSRPTLLDLEMAGRTLWARLTPVTQEQVALEAEAALNNIPQWSAELQAETGH